MKRPDRRSELIGVKGHRPNRMRDTQSIELGSPRLEPRESIRARGDDKHFAESRSRFGGQSLERLDEFKAAEQLRDDDVVPAPQVGPCHLDSDESSEELGFLVGLPRADRSPDRVDVEHQRQRVIPGEAIRQR